MAAPHRVCWPHAPFHELAARGTYILTGGTYNKQHYFRTIERLRVLHRGLLSVAQDFGWRLEAWSVFSNHYHFVGHSPAEGADNLSEMLGFLHEKTAKWINNIDSAAGRQVWYNFWGNSAYTSELVSCKTQLCPSKPGQTRIGSGRQSVSLVLGRLV